MESREEKTVNKDNKKMAQQRKADERARAERTAKGKKLLPLFALLLVAAIIAAAGFFTWRAKKKAAEMEVDGGYLENGQYDMSNDELTSIEIKVKDYGTIKADLDATAAPITVENFVSLAKEGFYDGLTFHRIMDEFMIQGGYPNGNGTGGSGKTIKGEFSQNGVKNPISHARGAISMARSQDMDSASSQFFIVQTDSYFLDNNYAGFGYVTEGMEIVDQICKDAKPTDDNGTIPKEEQPVIESITVLD
jgi:peptidyl-prolyl cis-trans isomerase B (cyclophilin B)